MKTTIYAKINRVAPDTDLAGYPGNIFARYRYPAGYPAK